MRAFTSAACISAVLLIAARPAAAQQRPMEFRLGIEAITSGIDQVAADSAGIGNRAYGVQFTGNIIAFRVLSLNGEAGLVGMRDEDPFKQDTNLGEKTSSVSAAVGTLSAGLRTPPLSLGGANPLTLSAGVNAGRSWLNVNRTIADNCVGCIRENVEVQAGTFWEPMVEAGMGRNFVNLRYRTYAGDSDFRNAIVLGISVRAQRPAPKAGETANDPQ